MKKPLSRNTKKLLLTIAIYCAVLLVFTIIFWPYLSKLDEPAYRLKLQQWLTSRGVGGWFILFGVMMVLTIIPLFSAAPLELIAGAMYGAFGGMLVMLAGCAAGSCVVFFLTNKYGETIMYKFFGKENVQQFYFVGESKNIEKVLMLLFLIPGFPKDILIYTAGISRIKLVPFLLISCVARIPSLLITTMMGDSVTQGKWTIALAMLGMLLIIGIVVYLNRKTLMDVVHKVGGARHMAAADKQQS